MNAIELNHVAKRYGDFALEDVNLTLPQGCVLGLIGENGAGKSTLIRMMLGACRPDGGEVRVLGEKAGRTATFTKVRQDIGVVLDEACLPDELTAQQVGKVMHGIYANWDDAAFSSLCARLDLPKGKKVKDFSRGTKMKLAIAVALSHKAKLLVLDEATGGLDPRCARRNPRPAQRLHAGGRTRDSAQFAYRDRSGKNLRLRGLPA